MQNHPVAAGWMLAAIDAMKSIGFIRQPFQIDQASKGPQLSIQGHFHHRLQQLGRLLDLIGSQPLSAIYRQQLAPLRQAEGMDTAQYRAFACLKPHFSPCQQ